MTTTHDTITKAVTTIVIALEHERDGLVTDLRAAETRLLAARSLLTPNGLPALVPPPTAPVVSPEPSSKIRAMLAARRVRHGGRWSWEQARDYLAERDGGPIAVVTLQRRLKTANLLREIKRRPEVFELCNVPWRKKGNRQGSVLGVRLVAPATR